MFVAIHDGRIDLVMERLNGGLSRNHANSSGNTLLHIAVYNRSHIPMVEALLMYGVDINAKDPPGNTALMWAIMKSCSSELIELLLRHGATLSKQDLQKLNLDDGRNVYQTIVRRTKDAIQERLLVMAYKVVEAEKVLI